MATDRARRTFDATRQYRAVVWQQGRVTVEADANEAEEIRAEESRQNLIDVIGSAGTPDDGYRVSVPAGQGTPSDFDFGVGPGTMYVGGLRALLAHPSGWRAQTESDWLDRPDAPTGTPQSELVLLWLQASEVSAVEDAALREPALGGPDTAARARLLPRILRIPVAGGDCDAGLAALMATWQANGLSFDRAACRVLSSARLQVSFEPEPEEANVCEPSAQSGYLGADNQLLRVQLVEDPTTFTVGHLVWGFDNASFLYRVTRQGAQVLKLGSLPVDEHHWPRVGQAVEVLRATARLDDGEYVAAPHGFTTTLASAWDPNTETVQLAEDLPAAYLDAALTPQLFLRIWQEKLPLQAGLIIPLGDTGVRVTLSNGPFVAGDHWLIGVRPGVPQAVFPQRLLTAPQPPDGPERWATPLALLRWTSPTSADISDCRAPFDDLVELTARRATGCCTLRLTPADLGRETLQGIIDRAFVGNRGGVIICLAPGLYELPAPLRFDGRHAGLTLEGCGGNVVIAAAAKAMASFADGLVVLNHCRELTLRRLELRLPIVPFQWGQLQVGEGTRKRLEAAMDTLYVSRGLQAIDAEGLRIDECEFQFSLPSQQELLVATGLRLVGGARAVQIERTRFTVPKRSRNGESASMILCSGVFGASLLSLEQPPMPNAGDLQRARALVGVIDGLTVRGCHFDGCFTALWLGGPLGDLRIEDNTVRGSSLGLLLINGAARMTGATLEGDSPTPPAGTSETAWWQVFAAAQSSLYRDGSVVLAETLQRMANPLGEFDAEPLAMSFHPAQVDKEERAAWERVIDAVRTEKRTEPSVTEPSAGAKARLAGATLPADVTSDLADTFARLDRVFEAKTLQISPLRLHARDNDFEATLVAFWLQNALETPTAEIVLCGNRLKVHSFLLPALMAAFVRRCTVTGNVITNEAPDEIISPPDGPTVQAYAATIMQGGTERTSVAVTGNAFVGWYWLPLRNDLPAPLNTWYPYNAGWAFPILP